MGSLSPDCGCLFFGAGFRGRFLFFVHHISLAKVRVVC